MESTLESTFMKKSDSPISNHHRFIWAVTRSVLEVDIYKRRKSGEKRKRHWTLFDGLMQIFGWILRPTPLYRIGRENARRIVLNRIDLKFSDLPRSFDGYTILHMTDLHLDFTPKMENELEGLTRDLAVDLFVLTGDYREKITGGFKDILAPMKKIVSGADTRDGVYATLGNHDTYLMVEPLEKMDINMLLNETVEISRGNESIWVTGLDDPYYYYTDQASRALETSCAGFKIALVHTPSLYDIASENGYRLYLCGHTHGGQICLPGGWPIIVHLRHGRKFYRGLWKYGNMIGYTGQGTGTVGLPLRFFTQSEITLFTLFRGP